MESKRKRGREREKEREINSIEGKRDNFKNKVI
jgi:hypothetical protein